MLRINNIYLLLSLLIFLCDTGVAGTFIVHSYDSTGSEPYAISAKLIDLDSARIINSAVLPITGTIINKTPIALISNNQNLFLCFAVDGWMAKNAGFSDSGEVVNLCIYTIRNETIEILHTFAISHALFEYVRQFPDEPGFRLAIRHEFSDDYLFAPGRYSINRRFRLNLISPMDNINSPPGHISDLDDFDYLDPIPGASSYHLFHTFYDSQYWLLKLNQQNSELLDSLQLRTSGGQTTIYAYHPTRDKFYDIHTNYEMHTELVDKNREDYYVQPEAVIYDPNTLDLIDTFVIDDYPDADYPGKENGVADVVDDYLVYYFFKEDEWQSYAPAMLFIFDTRTNEASWLRVGWR